MFTSGMILLYHGTDTQSASSIMEKGIDLTHSRVDLDFGQGFYTTTQWIQAAEFALRRADNVNATKSEGEPQVAPAVLVFHVNIAHLLELDGKDFGFWVQCQEEWGPFVEKYRNTPGEMHGFDYVMGPVADGYIRSKNKPTRAWKGMDQVSFHKPNAIAVLAEHGSECWERGDKGWQRFSSPQMM